MFLLLCFVTVICCSAQHVTWTQFQDTDNYYTVHRTTYGMDFWEATDYCQSIDSSLASIHSKAENDFIYNLAQCGTINGRNWNEMTLLGLRKASSKREGWEWSDESKMFTATNANFYLPYSGNYIRSGDWNDFYCNKKFKSIVCQKQVNSETDDPIEAVELVDEAIIDETAEVPKQLAILTNPTTFSHTDETVDEQNDQSTYEAESELTFEETDEPAGEIVEE